MGFRPTPSGPLFERLAFFRSHKKVDCSKLVWVQVSLPASAKIQRHVQIKPPLLSPRDSRPTMKPFVYMSCLKLRVGPYKRSNSLLLDLSLTKELVVRDFLARYKGTALGVVWSVFNPVLLLAVYTLVFGVAFKARWPGVENNELSFAVLVFSGMIIHGFFAECLNRAPTLITQNQAYVKKIVFPLEILPVVVVLSALAQFVIGFLVLVAFCLAINFRLHLGALLIPLILMPLGLVTLGLTWFLSSLGVFFRDLTHVVGLVSTVTLFLAPVFFAPENLPEPYRDYLLWNPITMPVLETRKVMLLGEMMDWRPWFLWMIIGTLTAILGYLWFQRTRKGFADVL